ncbi:MULTISPECIES: nucleoside hydrolase [Halanaerobium]|jgi:inosine-uridine nucleoside N-ribohydrolase|uniref:Inosine-uridine nucleoside N-ribohydrolase n=1 Tax=Halanaerobium kushneri TaxID=56779 RepID=A0A1N6VRM7_9FIRM|nr:MULTISPECIES: nucleoside hydrolase [Halanaerobium]RCW56540.1 inosine-uridine nucleoside N-ribohydrolase [Halanaerobium sp. ST460_2HS_T2]SIQ80469.1 Inosine-uridine nucleoside N-ribohydrolase [Halanaerobium kushneri]
MKKVILDCDNTIGIQEKDVSDGLAFLFLLGREDIDLMAVTSVFGNSSLEATYETTEKMISDFGLENKIKHYKGAAEAGDDKTEAAKYLAQTAAENKNEITLIAIGPLTNLYAAWKIDSDFFKNLKEIIIMGGITEPLQFGEQTINEIHFSQDPEAAEQVVKAEVPVALMSGNLCLAARFGEKSWQRINRSKNKAIRAYISDKIKPWYEYSSEMIGLTGFYMWDVVAVVYMMAPEIFPYNKRKFVSSREDLKTGQIKTEKAAGRLQDSGIINLPSTILDTKRFKDILFSAWDQIKIVPKGYSSEG